MEHQLKTWPDPFAAVLSGEKRHEVRRSDRDFKVGDVLWLREWTPERSSRWVVEGSSAQLVHSPAHYTGRELRCRVTYLSAGGTWGLPPGLCVMSIEVVP